MLKRLCLSLLLALPFFLAAQPSYTAPTPQQALSQLGRHYTITIAETAAGLVSGTTVGTICDLGLAPYNVNRYCADPTGVANSTAAFNAAYNAALQASPHAAIYVPAGTYKIPSPGLSWGAATGPGQNNIRIYGDGPNQSVLSFSGSNYTILTISADNGAGGGTVGTNLVISNIGCAASTGTGVGCLSLSDYGWFKLDNLQLYSSANALTMAGMAWGEIANVQAQTAGTNAAGNCALKLTLDTGNVANGPLVFNTGSYNGQSNVTTGGAVCSQHTFATSFNVTGFIAFGSALQSVFSATNNDDITIVGGYSEFSTNTTANTAVLFDLGATAALQNFTLLGGTYFMGSGGHTLNYAINAHNTQALTVKNATFAGAATSAIIWTLGAASMVTVENTYSTGSGNPPVLDASTGGPGSAYLKHWTDPWPRLDASLVTGLNALTGDGTPITVLFDTKNLDSTSSYATGTGIFTVPAQTAGMYDVSTCVMVNGLIAGNTGYELDIVQQTAGGAGVSVHAVSTNPGAVKNAANQASLCESALLKTSAGDKIFIQLNVSGNGSKNAGIVGSSTEYSRMSVRYIG